MAHENVGKGYIMATGDFSDDAIAFAKQHNILLVPGKNLLGAIEKLPKEQQSELLTMATDGDYATPTCPSCLIKLVKREGRRGGFWGCRNYPRCHTTINTRSAGNPHRDNR